MDVTWIIILVLAVAGLVWAYPKIPTPWNYIVVAIVVILALLVLANLAGYPLRIKGGT